MTTTATRYLSLSGDPELDALLFGTAWRVGADGTAVTTLSYSFAGYGSLWTDYGSVSEPTTGFIPLASSVEQQAVREALLAWSSVANIRFLEVADDATSAGDIRIAYTNWQMDANTAAYTYLPSSTAAGGDIWLNAALQSNVFGTAGAGAIGQFVFLHELGHALGLKHSFEASDFSPATLDSARDSILNTVESYYVWPGIGNNFENIDRFPGGPMAYDIAAMQYLYGANMSFHSGDDVYTFDGSGKYLQTIWDAGGEDTIRYVSALGGLIDLRPGHWSQLGEPIRIDGGMLTVRDTVDIYRTVTIENAIGGSGNDRLIGNDADNHLAGGAGDDTIDGGTGRDVVVLTGRQDGYRIEMLDASSGVLQVTDTDLNDGDDGMDALFRVEQLKFAGGDRLEVWADSSAATSASVAPVGRGWIDQEFSGRADDAGVISTALSAGVDISMPFTDLNVRSYFLVTGDVSSNIRDGVVSTDANYFSYTSSGIQSLILTARLSGNSENYSGTWTLSGNIYKYAADGYNTKTSIPISDSGTISRYENANGIGHGININSAPGGIESTTNGYSSLYVDQNGNIYFGLHPTDSKGHDHFTIPSLPYFTASSTYTTGAAKADPNVPLITAGTSGPDTWTGGAGNDAYDGGAGDDTIAGGAGNDTLAGGAGHDNLSGDAGNDLLRGDGGNDFIDGGIGADRIEGGTGDDNLSGDAGNDLLRGDGGSDLLDGGIGADRMEGGTGSDIYYVDNADDLVVETDNTPEGTSGLRVKLDLGSIIDSVISSISYTLTNYVEELILDVDSNALFGTGNELDNWIEGNNADNRLNGRLGDDTLAGSLGNDILIGGDLAGRIGIDVVILEGNQDDYVISRITDSAILNPVVRMSGTVKGVTETDTLIGIEKIFFVDSASYGLLTEDDLLKNTASIFDDKYEGDADANVFDGLAGNDSILGGGGNDSLAGGLGNDTLDGGTGSDQLGGGLGNDIYLVDTAAVADPDPAKAIAGDVVSEAQNAGIDKVQTSLAAYTLGANIEHLDYLGTPVAVLDAAGKPTGTSQVQQLAFAGTGNDLANTITGSTGNDTLDGGKGADRLIGGAGDDTYVVDRAAVGYIDAAGNSITIPGDQIMEKDAAGADSGGTDTIQTTLATYSLASIAYVENLSYSGESAFRGTGNILNNLISGGIANDVLTGGDGSDTLVGKNGNDLLKGGNGDDILNGGAGNDTLDGGNDSDTLILAGNRTDYVFSRPDIGKVQVATKDGTESDLLTGIEQIKFADGSTGQLNLDDLLKNTASKLDDNYEGDKDANVFDGLAGNDSLLGGGGNDSLSGGLGNDTLDGGTGSDQLGGGLGNDIYLVDTAAVADPDPAKAIAGDVVSETLNAGIDKVQTSLAAYTLGANIEHLDYLGTPVAVLDAAGKPTGTSQVQQLAFAGTGNELANILTGGTGNDSLGGGLGADTLIGGDGNDTLEGGEGTDRLEGGAGDDTYVVTSAADLVKETDATGNDTGGNDTLRAQVAGRYLLALNVENFAFDGADGVTASGNAGSNLITGGNGNDTLAGGAGNDTLNGGAGADRLSGGLDSDVFVFDTAPASGFDTITDFRSGEDKIQLDRAIFDKLGAAGPLNSEFFVEGKTALDGNDFLVYDKATGILWYDTDGSGDGAALQLALLSNKAVLAASDFAVL